MEGESFEFRCRISGYPSPQISWFKDGVCIDKARHYTIGECEGECILKTDKTYLEDSNEYSCKASNQIGYALTSAKLAVVPLEPTELPMFDEPLPNLEVKPGQSVTFECTVRGIPKPLISWYHNNRTLRSATDGEISYSEGVAKLSIKEAYPKTAGQYICKARNAAGK